MTDFIIVGRGLAAHVMANTLYQHQISFKIIGDANLSRCSHVAAGIYNPVVFKRLTSSWLAHQTVSFLEHFYSDCEKRFQAKFLYQRNIIRTFQEEQEKILWQKKSKNQLSEFLDETVYSDATAYKGCRINSEFSKVKRAGNLDVSHFISASEIFFKEDIIDGNFAHNELIISTSSVSYKNIHARKIIFCEGHLIKNNPFFNWLPLKPAKGEVLTVSSDILKLNGDIFNKGGFIVETSGGTFKCGATYEWNDLTDNTTSEGRKDLEDKLEQLISCERQVVKQEAGIRPASSDRRPLIGSHPQHKHVYVFNGLGTKGVMLAPYFANNFVLFTQEKHSLDSEADIKRFYSLFKSANP